MVLVAEDVAPADLPMFRREEMPLSHIAHIDNIDATGWRERDPTLPVTPAELPHHRGFQVIGADHVAGIHHDNILPQRGSGERFEFGIAFRADIVNARLFKGILAILVQYAIGRKGRSYRHDTRSVDYATSQRRDPENIANPADVNIVLLMEQWSPHRDGAGRVENDLSIVQCC